MVRQKVGCKMKCSVKFNGKVIETTVTNKAWEADVWVQKLLKQYNGNRTIGMDCKYIRHPISCMSNKMATLQLCFHTKCLVLQLLHMDSIPHSLIHLLGDSETTFAGVEIHEKASKLAKEYEVMVKRKVDVHFLAKRWFPVSYKGRPSMRALAIGIVGFSKRTNSGVVIKGNWESMVLDTELIEQACVDAYASYAIAHHLLTENHSLY